MDRKVVLLIDNAGSHFNPKQLEQSNENSTIVNDHNEEIIIINEESSSCSDNEEPIAESSQSSQRRKTNIAKYKHEYCKYLIHHFDNGTYNQSFDQNVPTKEYLNDEEIISLVQFEKMDENGNDSSSDEEIPLIPVKNAINGLETFINFFEQHQKILEIYLKRNTQDIQDLVNQHKENHITKFIETEATYNEIFAVKEHAKKLQNSIEIAIHNQFKHDPSMTNRIISLIKSKVELEAEKHTLDVLDKCVNDLRLRCQNVLCIDDGLKMICEHVNNSNEIIELKKSQIEQLNLINNQTITTFFNQLREVSEYIKRVLCPFSHDFEWIYKRIDCMMMKENERFQKLDLKITVQLYYENEIHHIGSLEIHRTLDDPFLKDVKDIIRSPKYLGAECIYMMLRELKSESKNWLSSVRNLMINCNKNDSYTKTIESMQVAIEYLKENQIPRHKAKIDDLTKTTFHAIHEILEERNDFLCNFAMIC
ncbi:11137_t:CDS:10 [Entrophospora sp. SA101]|nr:11137_t:CDS:10 [Entrophospora sp. SA101]